jgi:predicted metal-dependent hydrolase
VRGFSQQEGRHAREHERFFEALEAQGLDVRRFLRLYERVAYGVIERAAPPWLRLSTTAACEHYTAILAEGALRAGLLEGASAELRRLLLWHAAEEIEHRAVAFDVLAQVEPGYLVRLAGLGMATACLGGFWMVGTASLLAQEPGPRLERLRRLAADWRAIRASGKPGVGAVFARGLSEYVRPGFHPSQADTDELAATYLASVGLA